MARLDCAVFLARVRSGMAVAAPASQRTGLPRQISGILVLFLYAGELRAVDRVADYPEQLAKAAIAAAEAATVAAAHATEAARVANEAAKKLSDALEAREASGTIITAPATPPSQEPTFVQGFPEILKPIIKSIIVPTQQQRLEFNKSREKLLGTSDVSPVLQSTSPRVDKSTSDGDTGGMSKGDSPSTESTTGVVPLNREVPVAGRTDLTTKSTIQPIVLKDSPNPQTPGFKSLIQLAADRNGGKATIRASFPSSYDPDTWTRDITLSSPLSKSENNTQLATLDGLANSASIELQLGRLLKTGSGTLFFGATGRYGAERHNFINVDTLASASADRRPFSASGFLGYTSAGEGRQLIALTLRHQHFYADATPGALCANLSGASVLTCASGSIGAPSQRTRRNVELQYRYRWNSAEIDPRFVFDAKTRAKEFELPIYFIQNTTKEDKDFPFSGGVKLSWRSDIHRFVFGIVVGAPFELPLPVK